jgi:serine/threonine protein kinase
VNASSSIKIVLGCEFSLLVATMNVLPTNPPIRTSSSTNTFVHDKDIYHEMMKEMGISTSTTLENVEQLYFVRNNHSKNHSHNRLTFHEEGGEYEDYEEEDSDFALEDHDDDDYLVFKDVDLSKDLIFRKEKEDATEVTTTDTDVSLNCSSWHSSTSQRSGYSATSSSHSRSSKHVSASIRRLRYQKENEATSWVEPLSVHVFEDPITETTVIEKTCESVDSLQSHRMLGEGFFGQVFLVSPEQPNAINDTWYALKRLSKYHLLCEDQIHTVLREKEILQSCRHHPGIVTLYQTFQDDAYLYLLQSYIPGGELFSLLHNPNFTLTEAHAQFYTACIVDALWYLHCAKNRPPIVYRDLKPENIMLDAHGYPILIDFGYAKCLSHPDDDHRDGVGNEVSRRTYTLCGTSKYLSPEMIDGQGHGGPTDYWSLGIVVYELLSQGDHPFEFYPQMDDRSLFRAIAEADYLPLPENGISEQGLDFVDQLLIKAPQHRLGTEETAKFNPVLQHPWLRSWNVAELRQQSYPAPWVLSTTNDTLPGSDSSIAQSLEDFSGRSSQSGSSISKLHSSVNSHLTRREQALFAAF